MTRKPNPLTLYAILLTTYSCQSTIAYSYIPPPSSQLDLIIPTVRATSSESILEKASLSSSISSSSPSLLLALDQNDVQTQFQQMNDAMVLKTMQGTQWRIIEDRGPAMSGTKQSKQCTSTAVFQGYAGEPNKGTMNFVSKCGDDGDDSSTTTTSTGRWITKPSEIRRGAVQLSARWKVKLPTGQFIYKGFIQAESTISKKGTTSAVMKGTILTGDEVNKETVVGRFRADLVKQVNPSEKIGQSNGPVTMQ